MLDFGILEKLREQVSALDGGHATSFDRERENSGKLSLRRFFSILMRLAKEAESAQKTRGAKYSRS